MYNFLVKNGQMLAFGLGVIIVIVFLLSVLPGVGDFGDLAKEDQYKTGIFNSGLWGAIILTIVSAAAMILFGLFQILTDLKGSVKGLIGFGALILIFVIAFSMDSGTATPYIQGAIDKFEGAGNGIISAGNLKFISGGITTAGALVAIAALAFVLSEIRNLFK